MIIWVEGVKVNVKHNYETNTHFRFGGTSSLWGFIKVKLTGNTIPYRLGLLDFK